ncbi:hypothetical protein J2Z32_001917 [Paenibacillus turicensis]|uniref:WYL domain-containing protein n=1 Tax=Paenibacillus turicensis TaxID=160487 RepID=A0ABS4FRT3_9BACL|nr:hypothetical protein [Paenibacillus turicensis]MBP1905289.1 hypothetical protein [Paenibacillus turicensis]
MENNSDNAQDGLGYLFNVEILVKDSSNAKALQELLNVLNQADKIIDYRINSGMELGKIIEGLLAEQKQVKLNNDQKQSASSNEVKQKNNSSSTSKPKKEEVKKESIGDFTMSNEFNEWLKKIISENKLIRIVYDKGGKRVSIPCRILNFLPESYAINVYHVDEKQVYTFNLNQIIDFIEK